MYAGQPQSLSLYSVVDMKLTRAVPSVAILSALACTAAPRASAQKPVTWTAAVPSGAIAPGGEATVKLHATIADGWHIYAINQGPGGPTPTRITLAAGQPFAMAGAIKVAPSPRTEQDESFGVQVLMHEKSADFVIPIRAASTMKNGPDSVRVNARYQACNSSLCLPPQTARLAAAVRRAGK